MFKMKAVVGGEMKKDKNRNRPYELKSRKLLVWGLQLKLLGVNESGSYEQVQQ